MVKRKKYYRHEIVATLRMATLHYDIIVPRNGDERLVPEEKRSARLARRVRSALRRKKGMLKWPNRTISAEDMKFCIEAHANQARRGIGGPHVRQKPLYWFVYDRLLSKGRIMVKSDRD